MSKEIDIKTIMKADTVGKFMEKCNENFANIARNGGGPEGKEGAKGEPGALGKTGKSIHWISVEDSDSDSDDFTKEEATELLSVLKEEPEDGDVVFFSNGYVGYVKKVKEGSDDESEYIPEIDELVSVIGPVGEKGSKGEDSSGHFTAYGETLTMSAGFNHLVIPHCDSNDLPSNPPEQVLTILDSGISFIKTGSQQNENLVGFYGDNDLTLKSYEGIKMDAENGISMSAKDDVSIYGKNINLYIDNSNKIEFKKKNNGSQLNLNSNDISIGNDVLVIKNGITIATDTTIISDKTLTIGDSGNKTELSGNTLTFINAKGDTPEDVSETKTVVNGGCTIYRKGISPSYITVETGKYQFLSGVTNEVFDINNTGISCNNEMVWQKIGNTVNVNGKVTFLKKEGQTNLFITYEDYLENFTNFVYHFPIYGDNGIVSTAYTSNDKNYVVGANVSGNKIFTHNHLLPGNCSMIFCSNNGTTSYQSEYLKYDLIKNIPLDIMIRDEREQGQTDYLPFYFNSFCRMDDENEIEISHIQYSFSYLLKDTQTNYQGEQNVSVFTTGFEYTSISSNIGQTQS